MTGVREEEVHSREELLIYIHTYIYIYMYILYRYMETVYLRMISLTLFAFSDP